MIRRSLQLSDGGYELIAAAHLLALAVLFVGYVIEHVIAFNVSKGRRWLEWPRP